MIASMYLSQVLFVAVLPCSNVFATPIQRNAEVTPVNIPSVFGIYTTVATSDLKTGDLVS